MGRAPLEQIQGGTDVWGNVSWAPDDEPGSLHTHGELIAFRRAVEAASVQDVTPSIEQAKNMTADDASTWILERTPATFQVHSSPFSVTLVLTKEQKMIWTNYSFGIERDEEILKKNALDPTKWTNPLEVQYVISAAFLTQTERALPRLPNAPSMKIICVYGHGKETEVRTNIFMSFYTLNSVTEIILVCSWTPRIRRIVRRG
jgi:phospholipid:diacylglycerol acyltransferase